MLGILAGIGLYFMVKNNKELKKYNKNTTSSIESNETDLTASQKTQLELKLYHFGDQNMHFLPVSFSLTASFMSALTMIGWPTEIYIFGSVFFYSTISYIIACTFSCFFFIPKFYNGGYWTSYELLNKKFGHKLIGNLCKIFYVLLT